VLTDVVSNTQIGTVMDISKELSLVSLRAEAKGLGVSLDGYRFFDTHGLVAQGSEASVQLKRCLREDGFTIHLGSDKQYEEVPLVDRTGKNLGSLVGVSCLQTLAATRNAIDTEMPQKSRYQFQDAAGKPVSETAEQRTLVTNVITKNGSLVLLLDEGFDLTILDEKTNVQYVIQVPLPQESCPLSQVREAIRTAGIAQNFVFVSKMNSAGYTAQQEPRLTAGRVMQNGVVHFKTQ